MDEPATGVSVWGWRQMAAAAPTALFLVDIQGRVLGANDAAAGLVGAGLGDIVGMSLPELVAEKDRDAARHALRDLSEGVLAGFVLQAEIQRLDGGRHGAVLWGREVRVDEGPLVLVGAAPQSVLDLARLSQPVHRGRLALVTTDHDWRVFHATAAAASLLAMGPDELRGAALLGLVHPLDAGSLVTALASAKDDNEALSVAVRLGGRPGWREVELTVSRLCLHMPPRLACLLTPAGSPSEEGPVTSGELVPEATLVALNSWLSQAAGRHGVRAGDLSPHHWDIAARLMGGQTIAEVAEAMFLSPRTVRNHLSDVYRKFGVHTQAGLLSAIYAGVAERGPTSP